jgi:mRNA-degrading endonuclease RelE of RelBE toxin-antitoxin system
LKEAPSRKIGCRRRIIIGPPAQKELRLIDRETAIRILEALTRLVFLGGGDVKGLQGYDPAEYRLRVGEYRVRYRQVGEQFHVVAIRKRSDAYR